MQRVTSIGSTFGAGGATSLKAEIVDRVPKIVDVASYREARAILQSLGGVAALREEQIYNGFVDLKTNRLTVEDRPFNIFARLAAGKQPNLVDQGPLGQFQDKFVVCANRHENDIHWDSADPHWVPKASMSRTHRFLTTKDLHWQWFNPLVFGLVPPADGGVSPSGALAEVEQMKAAALQYAKGTGLFSGEVGLYVNVYGHNTVNSLFVHILDMAELGPSFKFHSRKNLPLEAVLTVLREEAAAGATPSSPSAPKAEAPSQKPAGHAAKHQLRQVGSAKFFFSGTDGATSLKEEIVGRVPVLQDAASFRGVRRLLSEELGGVTMLREELCRFGFVDAETDKLTTGTKPFNIFARVASGAMTQPGMEQEQAHLGSYRDRFMICCNRSENDEHWDSDDPDWVGKASMSRRHRFLTTKDLHWKWFNALVFGLVAAPGAQAAELRAAIDVVEEVRAAGLEYARGAGWGEHVRMFVHVFGHNSVNSLHVHILDMDLVGPTFTAFVYKNCPLEVVLKVLEEELAAKAAVQRPLPAPEAQQGSPEAEASAKVTRQASRRPADAMREVLTLNVGGCILSVARSTLLLAPPESLLHQTFLPDASPERQVDEEGRLFLDYPPTAFRIIVDHLLHLSMLPSSEMLAPRNVAEDCRQEVEDLAWILGVDDLVLRSWQRGHAKEPIVAPAASSTSWWCGCEQRRHRPHIVAESYKVESFSALAGAGGASGAAVASAATRGGGATTAAGAGGMAQNRLARSGLEIREEVRADRTVKLIFL